MEESKIKGKKKGKIINKNTKAKSIVAKTKVIKKAKPSAPDKFMIVILIKRKKTHTKKQVALQ